ncbi:MAG: response regulator, partial [Georgfuchsia sp.]
AARRLCGRIDAQVRMLLEGAHAVNERLMRDVLHGVAVATSSSEQIELVRSAYRLRELVPVEITVDDPREATLREMREHLAAVIDNWEKFCAGAAIALPRFHEQSAQLLTLAQKLGHVDLARLVAALANAANLLRKNPLLHSDALADEVATALLLTGNAVNRFDVLDVDFAAQVDVLTSRLNTLQRGETLQPHELPSLQALAQRASSRSTLHQGERGLRNDLQWVEQVLDAFFRDSSNSNALAGVIERLQKIAGTFEQLGQLRAVQATQDCARRIEAFLVPGYKHQSGKFEQVARIISALDFFVAQLKCGPADLDALLAPGTTPSLQQDEATGQLGEEAHDKATSPVSVALGSDNLTPPPPQQSQSETLRTNAPTVADARQIGAQSLDMLPLFLEECEDLVPAAAAGFRAWRNEGSGSGSSGTESLQRILHTLKGSARMAGAADIGEALHDIETRVAEAQTREVATPALIDGLETGFDRIAIRIGALGAVPKAGVEAPRPMLRVHADLVDTMVNESGEIAVARSRIEGSTKSLRASLGDLTENVTRLRAHLRELEIQAESQIQSNKQSHGTQEWDPEFDPLEMDRFTRLQELTRILVEGVNDVATVESGLLLDLDRVDDALTQQTRLARELTQHLMAVRMVPFDSISERLKRVVRMTSEETGKNVAFSITGGGVAIDRSVLECVTGPIEHLLRNAVVHGIETGEQRIAAGKSGQGEVKLTLLQAGNEVEIRVGDDGGGIDYPRIRDEAVKRGLLTAEQDASEMQLEQLIYRPGFTTASHLSENAGRGIGLDAVKNEIAALGGHVNVRGQANHGTTFSLHLPLTLAVVPVVLVKSGSRNLAIPSSMVVQASEMKAGEMLQLRSTAMMEWQGQQFDLHYLPHLLGESAAQPLPQRCHWVIMLRSGVQYIALEVDALIGSEEVVIKNLGPQLAHVPGISGVTVLGDGEVVLIVNPVTLVNARQSKSSFNAPENVEAALPPLVMVVDDSLTVRKITDHLLNRAGYRVMTAKDGVDALEQLAEAVPCVMLLDIEMPRMDGFELLRRLRADARYESLPVIIITSRIADKHRNHALQLGANNYLGKPYDEETLLAMIAEYLAK